MIILNYIIYNKSCHSILLVSVIIGFPFKSIPLNPHKYRYRKRPSTKVDGLFDGPSGIIGFHEITNDKNGIRVAGNQYFYNKWD